MWSDLVRPWQECLGLAWEAYCNDCIPIGALVTDADGNILSRGRNRIYEKTKPGGVNGAALAHAEVEALRAIDLDAIDPHTCTLYTTTEPCPMCMGTFYMSGLRELHYGARDPYAGSVNLLGKTWYLGHKPIKVFGPVPELEVFVTALFVEQKLRIHSGMLPESLFWEMHIKAIPEGVALGRGLYAQGELNIMRKNGIPPCDIYDRLALMIHMEV